LCQKQSQKNLILIGFKGCGKSSVGKALAIRLQRPFVDLDREIEALHTRQTGEVLPFRQIYKRYGPEFFRQLENNALREVMSRDGQVIALGGGTIFSSPGIGELLKKQIVIYLSVEPATLYRRIIREGIPAFFDQDNPGESFRRLYSQRTPHYESMAHYVFDNTEKDMDELVDEILATIPLQD